MSARKDLSAGTAVDHAAVGASPDTDPLAGVERREGSPAGGQSSGVLEWRDPPESPRIFGRLVMADLRANPGRWALIRSAPGNRWRRTWKVPAGVEVHFAYYQVDGRRWTDLYARWKGQP